MPTEVTSQSDFVRLAEFFCDHCGQWYERKIVKTITTSSVSKGEGYYARQEVRKQHPEQVQVYVDLLNTRNVNVSKESGRCNRCNRFPSYMLGPVKAAHAITFCTIAGIMLFAGLLATKWSHWFSFPLTCILALVSLGSICLATWVLLRWDPNRKHPAIYDTAKAPGGARPGTLMYTWAVLVTSWVAWLCGAGTLAEMSWHADRALAADVSFFLIPLAGLFALAQYLLLIFGADYQGNEQEARWRGEAKAARSTAAISVAEIHNADFWQRWVAL